MAIESSVLTKNTTISTGFWVRIIWSI